MRLKEVSVGKEFKIGLPQFSNMTVRCDLKVEIGEDEVIDWDKLWDEVNYQLQAQSGDVDPAWIQTKSYSNFFKTTIKTPKHSSVESKENI